MFKFSELKTVHLEISTRCQAACPMCPRNYKGGLPNPNLKIADWTYEEFVQVFDQETLDQLDGIYFCGNFGDPIMNNDLIPMCQYLKDNAPHIDLRIHTNGSARSVVWWNDLKEAMPEKHVVIFALDGLEDTHDLYRIGTVYELIIRNASMFIEAGGIAEWVFIKFKHNEHQVEEAERRSKELGFERFTVKNTVRFIGEDKFAVYDKEGNTIYHLEPPTDVQIVRIDKDAVTKFRDEYRNTEIDCYSKNNREIYIDAHKHVFPCCFLASAPYNNTQSQPLISDIRENMLSQYYDLVDSLGGIDNLDATKRTVNEILSDERWQSAWDLYWNEKKLMTCARVCGKNEFSKPKDQFVKRVSN